MRKYFGWVPNFITILNLMCGSIAIIAAFNNYLHISAILIFIAAVFDFFDGMSARLLHAYSDIGKQLDSLADIVSFGLTPSIIVYQLIREMTNVEITIFDQLSIETILPYVAFLIVIFSALRLAKFNIDERQTESFVGLPTPAIAIFFASLTLLIKFKLYDINVFIILGLVVFMSVLLVAEIPMFSLKFKHFRFKQNEIKYVFLFISIVLIVLLKIIALPIIIILYVLISIGNNIFFRPKLKNT